MLFSLDNILTTYDLHASFFFMLKINRACIARTEKEQEQDKLKIAVKTTVCCWIL